MSVLRPSCKEDIPRLRLLWELAFGDGGDYVDNFFHNYYAPERVLVLEEEGEVQSMTAWFGSTLRLPHGGTDRCAYLYAVATHPDCRGKGYAGALLRYCGQHLKGLGYQGLTTVPARAELHMFFAQNGFQEYFVQQEAEYTASPGVSVKGTLVSITPEEYRTWRETLLRDTAHIDLDLEGIQYQAGACARSGGGLFHYAGAEGTALLCVEGADDKLYFLKELLGGEQAIRAALACLPYGSGRRYVVRRPGGTWKFGMLQWLTPEREQTWNWDNGAYLGPAFD